MAVAQFLYGVFEVSRVDPSVFEHLADGILFMKKGEQEDLERNVFIVEFLQKILGFGEQFKTVLAEVLLPSFDLGQCVQALF